MTLDKTNKWLSQVYTFTILYFYQYCRAHSNLVKIEEAYYETACCVASGAASYSSVYHITWLHLWAPSGDWLLPSTSVQLCSMVSAWWWNLRAMGSEISKYFSSVSLWVLPVGHFSLWYSTLRISVVLATQTPALSSQRLWSAGLFLASYFPHCDWDTKGSPDPS